MRQKSVSTAGTAEKSPKYRKTPPVFQELKALAREQGLWNLFLSGARGGGLTNLEYAQ